MHYKLAGRARNLRQSAIRSMTRRAVEMGGVNLSQGLCDLPTPERIKEAACEAIRVDQNTYAPLNGLAHLRHEIALKLAESNRILVDPESQVTVTSGATGAFVCALLTLLERGDKVLNFEPFYGYHVGCQTLFDLEPVFHRLEPPDWEIDFELLERKVAAGVRALVLNTPANPSGKVFSAAELERIGDICARYDVWIITDEIYEHVVFGGLKHVSPASLPGLFERTVTISGFSKTFAMTGWRIGYAAGPAEVIKKMSLVGDLVYICAPHPLQAGLAEASPSFGEDYYQGLGVKYAAKLGIIAAALEKYGFRVLPVGGTYFLLADYSPLYGGIGSMEAARRLLEERGIASVPAESFYSGGEDRSWLRFCFAKEDTELRRAAYLLESPEPFSRAARTSRA